MADKEEKTKIQLEVYDEIIEVNVIKGEEEKYTFRVEDHTFYFTNDYVGLSP